LAAEEAVVVEVAALSTQRRRSQLQYNQVFLQTPVS
jgi:hypothetical protein